MDKIRKQHIETLRNVDDHIEYNEEYGGIRYTSAFVRMVEYVLELLKGPKQQTNADRIRGMSDEELAEFISTKYPCHMCTVGTKFDSRGDEPCNPEWCIEGTLEWLRQPVQPTPDAPDTHEHSGLLEE